MEYIPYIISNYNMVLVSYGYYSIISKGIDNYNQLQWVCSTTSKIKNYIVPKKEKWEFLDDTTIIEPEESNVFIMSLDEDFIRIDKLDRNIICQNNCGNPFL